MSSGALLFPAAFRCFGVGGGPRSSNCFPWPRLRSARRSMAHVDVDMLRVRHRWRVGDAQVLFG
eukprot:11224389-Lingulodinium_polyedra.AAC.1